MNIQYIKIKKRFTLCKIQVPVNQYERECVGTAVVTGFHTTDC